MSHEAFDIERIKGKELTCRYGPVKEDRIGYKDEQHRRVGGDVVRDGVLKALLTTAPNATIRLGFDITSIQRETGCVISIFLWS